MFDASRYEDLAYVAEWLSQYELPGHRDWLLARSHRFTFSQRAEIQRRVENIVRARATLMVPA